MKQFIYLMAICVFALAACNSPYKKGDNGLEYKIISDGNGKKVAYGNFLQIHITQRYTGPKKDTLLGDTREYQPRIEALDSMNTPQAYMKILKQTRNGDSVVIRISADSALKQNPGLPDFIKKGGYLYTTVKIINIFEKREQVDSANAAERKIAGPKIFKNQLEKMGKEVEKNRAKIDADGKIIEAYLAKNNIKATKAKWGTYIATQTEGTGDLPDYSSIISVNYTGRTLDSGKVFDSNVDPEFKHVQLFQVSMSQLSNLLLGWSDALIQMKKGTKATIYIPSSLAYGANGNPPKIKPNDNLIFDMEILDIMNEEQARAKALEERNKAEELQKMKVDSIQNAQKAKGKK